MVVNFSNIDLHERPVLILKNAGDSPLGILGYAKNVSLDLKYNEISTLEFELPAFVDDKEVPFYDDVVGMRIIEVQGVGQFTLVSPTERGDGIRREKTCTANSLEYEFVYKKISIPNGTYKFYHGVVGEDTVMGMILELMPAWSIGTVSDSLFNKYRTFEVNNDNLYNFMKGTLQESFNCIFDFDTNNRRINVRDINDEPAHKPVYISEENLAKEIEIKESNEDVVTRLDVNGAEGVTIRDVNPTGTNKLICLDHYMTTDNFSQALITKYNAWKTLCNNNRQSYYTLSIEYTLAIMQQVTEEAKLADLQGELTTLDNQRGVIIQSIAQGLQTQSSLDAINTQIAQKQSEIDTKNALIASIADDINSIFEQMTDIRDTCSYDEYFTDAEILQMDRYIKDGEISEASFVAQSTSNYTESGLGADMSGSVAITDAEITLTVDGAGNSIYDIHGGTITTTGVPVTSGIVSATIERRPNGKTIGSFYLSNGTYDGNAFPTGCASISGESTQVVLSENADELSMGFTGYLYFSLDASEYQQRSIAWELYEYGLEAINRLAYPSYTFSVDSANFLALEEYEAFKNHIELGQKVYVSRFGGNVLEPILIGAKISFEDLGSLTLEFGDSYVSNDSSFRLVDLLNKSVSMGKNVDLSRYVYASFVDSGASTGIKEYMNSALDTSKNKILSTTGQAITWDGAGFRLRKYSNASQTAFEPEQIWMTNNAIVMTDDAWATAKMAVGKFYDSNLGDCWGIVAPMIVGTILAGEELIIESSKRDGGTAVFRVDGDGCKLYNSDLEISKTTAGITTQLALNPDMGIAIGTYPLYSVDVNTGKKTLIEANAKFWADNNGNLHMKGNLDAATGNFTGAVHATSLFINTSQSGSPVYETIEDYVDEHGGGSNVIMANTRPTTGYKRGDTWLDTSNGQYLQYTAVDTTGLPSDWVLTGSGFLGGAALTIDPATGNATILANKTMTLATNGTLSLAGSGGVTIGSQTNITMQAGSSLRMYTGGSSGNSILLDDDGITMVGGAIAMRSNANMTIYSGGSFEVKTGNTDTGGHVLINNGGITMTGGSIDMQADTLFNVQSGGKVTIDASDGSGSYIYFGNNVSISQENGISADVGKFFGSLTLGGYDVLTKYDIPYRFVALSGTSGPVVYSGEKVIWIQTGSTKSRDDTWRNNSGSNTFGSSFTFSLTPTQQIALTGTTFNYEVQIDVYTTGSAQSNLTYDITASSSAGTVTLASRQPCGVPSLGAYSHGTVVAQVTSSYTNLMSSASGGVSVSLTVHGNNGNFCIPSSGVVKLTGSTTGSSGGWQDCTVKYREVN